jgi:hypothetical protein
MKRLAVFLYAAAAFGQSANLQYDPSLQPVSFAATEIRRAYAAHGQSLIENGGAQPVQIVIAATSAKSNALADSLGVARLKETGPQSYAIRRAEKGGVTTIAVLAAGAPGAMYGGLDVAEAVRLGTLGALNSADHSPYIEKRGIKFNIPLDVRTPSYSDNSDSAQNNIAEMWSLDFWHSFIDEMARHRYNVLTLWNLHPFPSIVKVPEYPDVALNDVMRTRIPMDDTFSTSGSDMVRPVTLTKLETLRTMTMDQKIAFWREVMQYAADRGVEVYWFTWNIFTYGAEGKYGIDSQQDNPKTIDYFRASVRELVLTYPLLAGIGITAGEHMQNRKDEFSSEKWLWRTYGLGIMDAKKLQPDRSVRLIHRYHQTVQSEILDAFQGYTDTFELSFKYAIAHMYSIPNPPFIQAALPHIQPQHRTWLTVRDDDVYSFRWGNPEFARAFVRNIPPRDKVTGFYMGPDGFVWGRDFLAKEPQSPRELVIGKRWYSFMLWGRLSFDPDLPDALFLKTLANRFPEAPTEKLSTAWSAASMVFPEITRFFWGDIDVRWFPEACLSHPRGAKGFYTVAHFMDGETMPGSGTLDIVEWRRELLAGKTMTGVTPLEIADTLAKNAQTALRLLVDLRAVPNPSRELRLTLGDMESMAYLGNYYAEKIRGAAELALYDKSSKAEQKDSAIAHLQLALDYWKRYATSYTVEYRQPILYNRVGWVDIPGLTARVEQDIAIARLWAPGSLSDAQRKRSADNPFRQ